MTLVAALFADSAPIIVADCLISHAGGAKNGIDTPLRSSDDRQGVGTYRPVGLARKFWQLPDGTMFLYSGNVDKARELFGHLATLVDEARPYSMQTHRGAAEVAEILRDCSFCAVPTRALDDQTPALMVHGNAKAKHFPNYGQVVAIGSGAQDLLELLDRYQGVPADGLRDRELNAYEVCARLNIDYMKATGSRMSAASTGGFFEVVQPELHAGKVGALVRNSAHLFLDVTETTIEMPRAILAFQGSQTSVIVVGGGSMYKWGSHRLTIPIDSALEFEIAASRIEGAYRQFSGTPLPSPHIQCVVIYAESVHPSCGHAFRTHSVLYGDGMPAAFVHEYEPEDWLVGHDASADPVEDSIVLDLLRTRDLESMLRRMHQQARCEICDRASLST